MVLTIPWSGERHHFLEPEYFAKSTDLPPKNRTEHRVRESVQVREKGERNEQAEAVRS